MAAAAAYYKDPLSGRPGKLHAEQETALSEFKEVLEKGNLYQRGPPPSHDDPTLLRFLRARRFDLDKAKLMFQECEKWRKEMNVDELYKSFDYSEKAQVNEYYPCFYHKTDKDGRPVYIEQLGKVNLQAMYKITSEDRMLKNLIVEYEKFQRERLPVCSKMEKRHLETSCTILDLSGVGISQFWEVKDYVSKASHIGQNYYPESMGKFYIINAPYLFKTVWSIVKSFLDEVTVNKIAILGSNYQSTLLEQIPADNLPKQFGGKCECPGGCSLSNAGPWKEVAEGRLSLDDPDAQEVAKKIADQDTSHIGEEEKGRLGSIEGNKDVARA